MNGRYTFLLVCLLLTLPISSSRTTNNGEETLVNITLADGLAGETVYRVMSDHGGRTWIATSSGISVYNGKDYPKESTDELVDSLAESFPDMDVEANYGGQPIYYCILSVE